MTPVSKMNVLLKLLLLLLSNATQIKCMAIKGPVLTRYDPCNLAVIHFDKVSERLWQGVLNLNLYPNLESRSKIEFHFDKDVKLYGASNTSNSVSVNSFHRDFVLTLKDAVPQMYVFFVKIEDHEDDVPTITKFVLDDLVLCDEELKASQTIKSLNLANEDQYTHVCGRRSLDHAELTSVRTESEAGDWPWHIALLVKDVDTGELKYECGGSIISTTAIVTAGHCVSKNEKVIDPERVIILAGVDNHQDPEQVGRQEFVADEIILHPNYDDIHATSDVAVVKVSNLKFTKYVQPICVWGPVYDKANLFGYPATIVGFGTRENGEPSDTLRSTNIMVQDDATCIAYSRNLYTSLLNEFTFCAGFGPKDAVNGRNGDSGGGLIVPTIQKDHKISWFLRGVLSKCGVPLDATQCDPKFYTVYTDVGPHYGWIYHHSGLEYRDNIIS